jgi:cytolysin-activating lysine-acyltransferase
MDNKKSVDPKTAPDRKKPGQPLKTKPVIKNTSTAGLNKTDRIKQATKSAGRKGADEIKKRSDQASGNQKNRPLTLNAILGDVCWLLSQSGVHRYNFFLADLEWLVLPAIMNGQYKLFQAENRPVGFAVWAYVSDDVQKRLAKGAGKLAGQDWRSGKNLWLIDVVAPFGQVEQMLADLKRTAFKGKLFKYHRNNPDGGREVVTVQPEQVAN